MGEARKGAEGLFTEVGGRRRGERECGSPHPQKAPGFVGKESSVLVLPEFLLRDSASQCPPTPTPDSHSSRSKSDLGTLGLERKCLGLEGLGNLCSCAQVCPRGVFLSPGLCDTCCL